MFELGIISDEISDDFERSCRLISEWGMRHVELRTMWDKNILALSEAELEAVAASLEAHRLSVTAIASPVFKSPLDGKPREIEGDFQLAGYESFEAQLELIRKAAILCERFGTDKIRIFSFWREPWTRELVAEVAGKLLEAAGLARDLGVVLVVENEPVCCVGTGQELGELFAEMQGQGSAEALEHIAMLWDPGNARHAGETTPYPDGYEELSSGRIVHVHLKDAIIDGIGNRTLVPLGQGEIDYVGQFRRLQRDGYRGVLVLEPHYYPEGLSQEEAALRCVEGAREVLERAFAS
ncbi:MAG: sugar phosphate isomerase/epimerase [Gemmatimonadota bacterium]|nr:MAG: sugar phosphate isomerase/epimerase [Gemmatimonadota bacterium]UCH26502.1 MAG: sugar phosphate isomerase/epimerase [Trueperaceae bacterium]